MLAVAVDRGLLKKLSERGDLSITPVDDQRAALLVLAERRTDMAAVLVGAGAERPIAFAQEVYRVDRHVPVLLLAGADAQHDELSDRLRVAPFIGRDTRCVPAVDPALVVDDVIAAATRELRRRSHVRTMQRISAVKLPAALPELDRSSQYLGQILEHAPIGVVVVDSSGTVRGWNPRASEITGRLGRDAVDLPLAALFAAGERKRFHQMLAAGCGASGATSAVLERTQPDGSPQFLEVRVAGVDPTDEALGCLVLLQDVTERVMAERELAWRARTAALAAAVGMALTSAASLDEKLARCAEGMVHHLDAAFARIWLLDRADAVLVLRASAGMYTNLDGSHSRVPVGQLKIGRIAATVTPHLTNQVVGDPDVNDQEWARRERMVAFAGYPLVVSDGLVGVMALFSRHRLSQSTLDALASVADAIALGVQQARDAERVLSLLEGEQRARAEAELAAQRYENMAKTLQQSLLPPRLPDVPGLEVAARYHWAGDGSTIGGDFYDVFPLADGRVCAAIGDVSGKGVDAASLTALVRHTLRAAALSYAHPRDLLVTLNSALLGHDLGERFCTVALVAVAPGADQAQLAIAVAGHPLPVLVTKGGVARPVGAPGPPAGMLFDADVFTEASAMLLPGDSLVLYTDGVVEARSSGGQFFGDLFFDLLTRCGGWPAAEVTAAVESTVLAFESGIPRDDLAVLALHLPGPPTAGPADADDPRLAGELPRLPAAVFDPAVFHRRFPAQPSSVAAARHAVVRWLAEHRLPCPPVLPLVLSELATNAGRAARTGYQVRAWEEGGAIVLEVADDGYGIPKHAAAGNGARVDAEYGRGLFIVRSLVEGIEISSTDEGTTVRCRMAPPRRG